MSRTSFWILLPFLLTLAGIMVWIDFFLGAVYTVEGCLVTLGVFVIFGALGLAFYDSKRFWWAGFFLATCLFFLYMAYVIYEWFFTGHPWNYAWASHSAASPLNAVAGLVTYGIPAFWYVFTGKFRPDEKECQEDFYEDEQDDEDEDWTDESEDTKWYGKP